MIKVLKKLAEKSILAILIIFFGTSIFSSSNTACAVSLVKNEDFEKIIKSEIFLKNLSRNKGKLYVSCNLYKYIKNAEGIKKAFNECWSIDGKFNVFIFSDDNHLNIARNVAWDMFKKKARYFIVNEKQSMMDSIENVERLIYSIKNKILPVYNDYLLSIGQNIVEDFSEEDLEYLCTEACRIYHCYALDFEGYIEYCCLFKI